MDHIVKTLHPMDGWVFTRFENLGNKYMHYYYYCRGGQ
jgi:hypothetical protein